LFKHWLEQRRVRRRVARQHLLRGIYEWCESRLRQRQDDPAGLLDCPVHRAELRKANHWTEARLQCLLRLGLAEGLLTWDKARSAAHLTARGKIEARRVTRNHRLWETYLLRYADVAPQHVHHNADQIEHVIDPDIVNELEELLAGREGAVLVPADPEKTGANATGDGIEI
jgi:hypothetical protein